MKKSVPKKPEKKDRVLADHQKRGKTLVPPMLQIGPISPVHFDRDTLPELVWLALVEKSYGLHCAASLAAKLGEYIQSCKSSCRFITLSEMKQVDTNEWLALKAYLKTSGVLDNFLNAIHDFTVLYPECPLSNQDL